MNKKIVYFLLMVVWVFPFCSCSDEDENEVETVISYSELPSPAQKLINSYFGGESNVEKVIKDIENTITLYEVNFKDGYEIIFNEMGYWQEIDAPSGKTIPTAIIPEPIVQTLKNQYYGYGVVEINTTGDNYHLVLSNNQGGESIDMLFNQSGEILSTGTM